MTQEMASAVLDEKNRFQVSVFPNPFSRVFQLAFAETKPSRIAIYNLAGQVLFQEQQIDDAQIGVEIPAPPGMYFLKVE